MPRPTKSNTPADDRRAPSTDSNAGAGAGGVIDRRLGLDRREIAKEKGITVPSGLERRRGPGRRLSDFSKAAEDGEMTTEQFLFLVAIDEFKKANDRPFPTWTDVLEVVRLLGYRKTQKMELSLPRADDWTEAPDAPSNVRPDNWGSRPVNPMGRKSRLAEADEPTDADFEQLERELDELEGMSEAA